MTPEGTTPEAIFHIGVGSIAMLSGATALFARKGSRLHRAAGSVFFASILTTAATGVYLGFISSEINNAIAGIVTIYLVLTAWMAVRRKEGEAGLFELGGFLFAATGAGIAYYFAFDAVRQGTAMLGGIPYFTIATIVALAAIADLSVILRRGVSGKQRIARHLWRMNLGFAAAVGSFFPGQIEHFPEFIREIKPFILLFVPFFLVIGLMLFWLIWVLFTNWYKTDAVIAADHPDLAARDPRPT